MIAFKLPIAGHEYFYVYKKRLKSVTILFDAIDDILCVKKIVN